MACLCLLGGSILSFHFKPFQHVWPTCSRYTRYCSSLRNWFVLMFFLNFQHKNFVRCRVSVVALITLCALCCQTWSNEARTSFLRIVTDKKLYAVIMNIDPVSWHQHFEYTHISDVLLTKHTNSVCGMPAVCLYRSFYHTSYCHSQYIIDPVTERLWQINFLYGNSQTSVPK